MKIIYLLSIFLLTLNCSINKVSNNHGFRFLDEKFKKISVKESNKNDVRNIIGPPSSKSKFDDIWFYIERKKTNQSLIKLGKKKISENNIVIIEFNNKDLVINKSLLDIKNMQDLEFAEKRTIKKFSQDNFVHSILTTLREKINAPTRRKR